MIPELELFPTPELKHRYGVGKQTIYDRMEDLQMKPIKRGFISIKQLDTLDKLNDHIKHGGTVNEFLIKLSGVSNSNGNSNSSIVTVTPQTPAVERLDRIIEILDRESPLQKFRDLKELAKEEFVVPTSLLKLMGISPHLKKGAGSFIWGSFQFYKSTKVGRENGWLVKKIAILE